MLVTVDGQRLDRDFASGCALQELIDQVRETLHSDRLVVSVAINGQPCGEAELAQQLGEPLAQDVQVDLETGDRWQLAADALRAVAGDIVKTGQQQPEIADQLNAGRVAEGMQRVGEFPRIWQVCHDTVRQCCNLLARDLTDHEYEGRCVREYLDDLATKLRELRDALEARDTVLLTDLIYYELQPLCESWSELLNNLADTLVAEHEHEKQSVGAPG
ncbi:MAG: hypothetical protein KKB50_20010 [Planctomycetes bacterium]|nr:hypothetical protein [Planctomycetota bacterium]